MKTSTALTLMLLSFLSINTFGQGTRTPPPSLSEHPRWQKEAMVKDLIRLDECDSTQGVLKAKIDSLHVVVEVHERIDLEHVAVINQYEQIQFPQYDTAIASANTAAVQANARASKYKRQRDGAGVVVVVVIILALIF